MSRRLTAGVLLTFALVGCNPNGTCTREGKMEDSCVINITKGTCGFGGEWVKENEVSGVLHCKMAGYDERRGAPEPKKGEMTYFYRQHRVSGR